MTRRDTRVPPYRGRARGAIFLRGECFLNQTSNYQLSQWDPEDRILRTDFNSDNAKVDAALKANANAISSEASTRSSAVSSLTTKLNKKGNVKVEIMTYEGTGEYGASHPSSLTFSGRPLLVLFAGNALSSGYLFRGSNFLFGVSDFTCSGSWSGNTYSWWNTSSAYQLNQEGYTYTVVAFYNCDE